MPATASSQYRNGSVTAASAAFTNRRQRSAAVVRVVSVADAATASELASGVAPFVPAAGRGATMPGAAAEHWYGRSWTWRAAHARRRSGEMARCAGQCMPSYVAHGPCSFEVSE